ncbi:MAG: hypothetical protein J6K17_14225 [Oscillospiraceae bacterium]|nr:hypothetical protein [Oscillospiraceae bacterium]
MENKFEYTYSALQNAEIEKIRKKYAPQTSAESKLEQIKKLDSSVESKGIACALAIGIPGSLILGLGMCCCLVWTNLFVLGIFVGILGIVMCGAAYPIYKNKINKRRAEVGPLILKLTQEIENNK